MNITPTDSAGIDPDIDIVVIEWLGFELRMIRLDVELHASRTAYFLFMELGPGLLRLYLEAFESVWIPHGDALGSYTVY